MILDTARCDLSLPIRRGFFDEQDQHKPGKSHHAVGQERESVNPGGVLSMPVTQWT